MKTIIHKADSRGHANYGWLDTHYSFSFANYYNPERVNFGALRVLNDDHIDGGLGFDRHPHDNMEIVTIALEGELEHKDSMGHTYVIRPNEVQIMSAGTGIFHSEYNHHPTNPVKLFQIWVFPEKKNIAPRYDQKAFDPVLRKNQWQRIVSPNEEEAVWINQDAYFSLITLDAGHAADYELKKTQNGVYLFVIEGSVKLGDTILDRRDGAGVWETPSLTIEAQEKAEVLLMEIPMKY
jgi:quercetin 2,3-dioxygenase